MLDHVKVALSNDPFVKDTFTVSPVYYKLRSADISFVVKDDSGKSYFEEKYINAIPYNHNGLRKVNYYVCRSEDTVLFASVYDSLGMIYRYEKYWLGTKQIKFSVHMRVHVPFVRFFDESGFCYAEGISQMNGIDILSGEKLIDFKEGSPSDDIVRFMELNHLLPKGNWIFYFKETGDMMTISFDHGRSGSDINFSTTLLNPVFGNVRNLGEPEYFDREGKMRGKGRG